MKMPCDAVRHRRTGGLTLVELVAGLAILCVFTAAAYPVFSGMLARQQVTLAADRLAMSLALARATALSRRVEVTLQPLPGESTLSPGWQLATAGASPDQPVVLSVVEPGTPCLSVTLRQTVRGANVLKFLPVGYSRSEQGGFQAATFTLGCRGEQRQVRLGAQGRIRLCTPGRDADCEAESSEPP
ncbi:putative TYPE 4 FIMBRIAL PILIN fimT-related TRANSMEMBRANE PROTEIN [Cupriavidus taiwanensis]|nr:GspH/FimT family pseudopilin [Cupriavidus taiwanensis]SOY82272.1 putative TYPE 4 FIMBRIAL PILIN fimT-related TRANSMEMBRANE PROTEIN [Cupriavidus taiwanensis]SOY82633.1 putative TYPE 4 FIMBRIAL PILIN fimT-related TRANSMEMBRANE PROTEIN [Cupriavidus taiwanensis]